MNNTKLFHSRILEELGQNLQRRKSYKPIVKSGEVIGKIRRNWVCQSHLIKVHDLRDLND